jgi:hypothetical protein
MYEARGPASTCIWGRFTALPRGETAPTLFFDRIFRVAKCATWLEKGCLIAFSESPSVPLGLKMVV